MAENLVFSQPALAFTNLGSGLFAWQSDTNIIPLTAGETYTVEWDGVRHTCQAVRTVFSGTDVVVIGNDGLLGTGENNGMPFLIGSDLAGNLSMCYTTDQDETNNVAIYHVTEDPKDAIPDTEYLIWGSTLTEIADAIRAKSDTTDQIAVSDMAAKISAITGAGSAGSSDVEVVYVTFMSHDGSAQLYKRAVVPGNSCVDVVSFGLLDTPVKESSTESTFTFSGWSLTSGGSADSAALSDVTENRIVYAAYTSGVRTYDIRFWDGTTLLTTLQVNYGETPEYTTEKEGYRFEGWSPAISAVSGEADYYAQWVDLSQMVAFGTCGDNISWTLDGNYVLTLTGTGATINCSSVSAIPWYDYRANVAQIVVEEGITALGSNIFNGCTNATTISLPSTLDRFEHQSCYNCASLTAISIPESVTSISISAFSSCSSLTSIVIPDNVTKLDMMAFAYCSSLTSIVIGSGVTHIGSQAFINCSKLASVTFCVTSGWWVNQSSSATSGTTLTSANVANTSTAATYLKTTYLKYYWNRS